MSIYGSQFGSSFKERKFTLFEDNLVIIIKRDNFIKIIAI